MRLKDILVEKRSEILNAWSDMIMDTYPPDAAVFYKTEKDRFLNPVGYIVNEGIGHIYDRFLNGGSAETLAYAIDRIIRVMAVQDIPPSKAVSFVFMLKKVLKDLIGIDTTNNVIIQELNDLYDRIEETALVAFDVYMGCREDISRIRMDEIRQQGYGATMNPHILKRRRG